MKKKYYHYKLWEDYKSGLFTIRQVDENKVELSKELLSSPIHFASYCMRVLNEWPIASSENLTNLNQNRRAWLGQAACCLAHNANDYETKLAWSEMTDLKRDQANKAADMYINHFEVKDERKDNQTYINLD